jgi:hypothetical protein
MPASSSRFRIRGWREAGPIVHTIFECLKLMAIVKTQEAQIPG